MTAERQPVKQLDHVIVRTDDPQPLFSLLSETLQLLRIVPEKIRGLDVRLVE